MTGEKVHAVINAHGDIYPERLDYVQKLLGAEGLSVSASTGPPTGYRPALYGFLPLRATIRFEEDFFTADDFQLTGQSLRRNSNADVNRAFSRIVIPSLATGGRYRRLVTPETLGLEVKHIDEVGLDAPKNAQGRTSWMAIEAGSFIKFMDRLTLHKREKRGDLSKLAIGQVPLELLGSASGLLREHLATEL